MQFNQVRQLRMLSEKLPAAEKDIGVLRERLEKAEALIQVLHREIMALRTAFSRKAWARKDSSHNARDRPG